MKQTMRIWLALVLALCAGTTAWAGDLTTGTLTSCTVAFSGDGVTAGTPPTATAGSTVTITVSPSEGYATKGITVRAYMSTGEMMSRTRGLIEDITATQSTENANVFTITMPAANIVVDATTTRIIQNDWISVTDPTYTGSALEAAVTVTDGTTALTAGTDYEVSYSNNTNAALSTAADAPTVTVTGIGNYSGTATKTFTIDKAAATISFADVDPSKKFSLGTYTNTLSNTPAGGTGGTGLGTVAYTSSAVGVATVNASTGLVTFVSTGTATITATVTDGTNYTYSGMTGYDATATTASITYTLTVENGDITASATGGTYTYSPSGSHGISVSVTKPATGATVMFGTTAGTYNQTASPKYSTIGSHTVYYKVTADNYNDFTGQATVTIVTKPLAIGMIQTIADQTYTGSALTPAVTLKDGSKTLTKGTDYTVSYSNNTNAGTATVTATGKGNYSGTASQTFTIAPKSLADGMISPIGEQTYTGGPLTPEVEVKDGETTLVAGTDYTVAYADNTEAGTATVTVTGQGNYTGDASTTFTIVNNGTPDTDEEASVTIGPTGKTTYTGTRDLDFTGCSSQAYVAVGYDANEKELTLARVYLVPAGTPILIKGSQGVNGIPFTTGVKYFYKNMFVGNASGKTVEIGETGGDKTNYVLTEGKFNSVNGNAFIPNTKAYLQLPTTFPSAVEGINQTVMLTSSGKATLCSTVDLDFSGISGMRAYIATGYNFQTKKVMLSRVLKASAGTPLVLKGQSNGTYTIPSKAAQTAFVNMFVGNPSSDDIVVGKTSGSLVNYYLSNGEFKAVVDELTVPGGKCYLQLPASAASRTRGDSVFDDFQIEENDDILVIRIDGDASETTGVEGLLKAAAAEPDVYYNLNGQRTENPGKGIYVKGGRKVIVK